MKRSLVGIVMGLLLVGFLSGGLVGEIPMSVQSWKMQA